MGALFRARYPELARLADLLGADDPEDIAQEAFARLIQRQRALRNQDAALAYVRSTVCNRHRHLRAIRLRLVRLRTPGGHDEASSEHAVMLHEDRRELLAALGRLGQDGGAKPPSAAVSVAPACADRAPDSGRGGCDRYRHCRRRHLADRTRRPERSPGNHVHQARDPERLAVRPGPNDLFVREIPPVTPFTRIKLFADGHPVLTYLWFGYVPGYASAGIALCEVNDGGVYGSATRRAAPRASPSDCPTVGSSARGRSPAGRAAGSCSGAR